MAGFIVELQGLEKFKETFNTARIPKAIALGTGIVMKQLNSMISHAVALRYNTNKPLSSVLVGGSASNVTFGKNIITGDLQYRFVPMQLGLFLSSPPELGNIPPLPKKRLGLMQFVEVIRGQRKISHGIEGLGGFTHFNRKYLIERDEASRYPIHQLFAPTLSQMAGHVILNDSSIIYFIDNIYSIIEDKIQL